MILYKSSRGKDKKLYSFSEAILKGIAEDGGLLSPTRIPSFSLKQLQDLSGKSYQRVALFVFNLFRTDLPINVLRGIVNNAYSKNFDHPDIVPIKHLKNNQFLLELWHGPTLAFKDIALQILPLFFSQVIKGERKYLILVATSGDTGKAALEGYKNKDNVSISVFYPEDGVSKLQQLQMTTQDGDNVAVYAMTGDFDQVQRVVKEVFNDQKFNRLLADKYNLSLSSANSINWGRLMPQIVYYLSAYIDLVKKGAVKWGDLIDIVVPTGNFGNILAAFYARKMGVPIGKLICASNQNNVLSEFLQKGIYDLSKRELVKTSSPAMDILVASNVERLLFILSGDGKKISDWMKQLKEKNKFIVDEQVKKILIDEFYADWVSDQECLLNIKLIHEQTGHLIDPHTSVAQVVAERYASRKGTKVPLLICSTAHWAKFAKVVYQAINNSSSKQDLNEFEMLEAIHNLVPNAVVPKSIGELNKKQSIHKRRCEPSKQAVEKIIEDYLQN